MAAENKEVEGKYSFGLCVNISAVRHALATLLN